jgi:diguanylate cyclase
VSDNARAFVGGLGAMRLLVLAFGLWSAEGSLADPSGGTLTAIFATALTVGLVGLGVAGIAALLNWRKSTQPVAPKVDPQAVKLRNMEVQLDQELAIILRFMRTYVDANDNYSKSLAQAHKHLPSLTKPEQVRTMVKFLIAENEKIQRDAADLRNNLDLSRSQIEKLRWNLAEAQELGMRDPLTALNNRRCFDLNLAKEIADAHAHKSSLCLVMGDIDRFKAINDTFGHQIGDEILKMFAKLLSNNVKGRDTVARFGGEEFAIILPETELDNAANLTESIRGQLEAKELALNTSGEPIGKITASFGVAQLAEGDDSDALVQRADARLYEAKCAGRNRVVDRPMAA